MVGAEAAAVMGPGDLHSKPTHHHVKFFRSALPKENARSGEALRGRRKPNSGMAELNKRNKACCYGMRSKQLDEVVDREVRIANNGA
jgi:hypothetical protein